MAMKQQNIEEAEALLKDAMKALKTTMFKWKPDNELAAEKFDKAGVSFKLAKEYDRSISAFKEAAAAHKAYLSMFHCAKSFENAANAARDGKKMAECNTLLTQAAQVYLRSGTHDAAALALEKAAKDAEKEGNVEVAMNLYMEVVDIRETEDQTRRIKVPLDKAVQMSIRCKKFKLTMEYLNKEALLLTQLKDDPMMNRNWMCRIIVMLALGDFGVAEQMYEEAMCSNSFNGCDEMFATNDLLDAYDAKDQEQLDQVTKRQIFSFLSNDSALLARKLQARGGTGRKPKTLGDLGITEPTKAASRPVKKKQQQQQPQPQTSDKDDSTEQQQPTTATTTTTSTDATTETDSNHVVPQSHDPDSDTNDNNNETATQTTIPTTTTTTADDDDEDSDEGLL